MKNNHNKKNEIDYPSKLSQEESVWLYDKPFGKKEEVTDRFRDFSHIIYILSQYKRGGLLDIGAGSGWTSIFLAKCGFKVMCTDISDQMIKIARKKAKEEKIKNIEFSVIDNEKIDFQEKFDFVLIYDTLHHCPDDKKVLKNCYKALKKGGHILVVEPNSYHGKDPEAQKIAKYYGTLEKGFKPGYLINNLKKIGFTDLKRYYCNAMLTRPYSGSLKDTVVQIFGPLLNRLFFSRYKSQIWLLATK